MLGQLGPVSDPEDVFRVLTPPRATDNQVMDLVYVMSAYCLRYPVISRLYRVFASAGSSDILTFLSLYGGIEIRIPLQCTETEVRRSHLPDIAKRFGGEVTDGLLGEFAEGSIKVPPTEYLIAAVRDVDVYLAMNAVPAPARPALAKRLSTYYGVSSSSVLLSFRRVRDSLVSQA